MSTEPVRGPNADPRPLTDEPLPLDLVNTVWIDEGVRHDLLKRPGGLTTWLATAGFADTVPSSQETLDALLVTRTALCALLDERAEPKEAINDLNETLRHGRILRVLSTEGPEAVIDTDAPSWLPAWSAAETYLQLLEENPDRIRKCANPECVLHFYDVSKNGGRRWCSMAGCGNRAKTRRHYTRHRKAAPSGEQ
ncbi:CGNR zinc finger domain-containing protein [Streptomyces sp. NPDC016459]|uniref:CGNR zinc finger domain-containing protein n=1 Tax=Streptomyces sp. NPDC016459 TaxID=3157190 RepID=UPI0033EF68C9